MCIISAGNGLGKQQEKNSYKEFLRDFLVISAPVVFQSVLGSLVNMLDVMMIGQLGEVAITASAVSGQWFNLFFLLANSLCAAGGMFISQYWGKRDQNSIHQFMGILFYGVLLLGAFFMTMALVAPGAILGLYSKDPLVIGQGCIYLRILAVSIMLTSVNVVFVTGLRSIGLTKVPMIASAVAVITNGTLNFVLIFGKFSFPELGMRGAAVATVVARTVEFLIVFCYVVHCKPPVFCGLLEYVKVEKRMWQKYLKVGFWVIVAEALYAFGSNFYSMAYKYTGTEAQAALQIIGSYQNLAMIMCGGFGTAAAVMIGSRLGQDKYEEAKLCCRRLLLTCAILSVVISAVTWLCAPLLMDVYQVGETVNVYLRGMILILVFSIPLKIMNFLCIVGILRSGGDSTVCFAANMVGVWLVGLPLVWLAAVVWKLPIYIVFLMANMEDVGKFLIAFPRVLRYRWMNNLTT